MGKYLHGVAQSNSQFFGAVLSIFLLLASFQPAFAGDSTEIKKNKELFMSTLASMPYTSGGSGPVLYVFEFSECPFCQAFEKEWKGKLEGIEVRRLVYGATLNTVNEAAYLARTRDINDFYAFMDRKKVAPDIRNNNDAIDDYNKITGPIKSVLVPILKENGWPARGIVSPQFMWESNGRVYVQGGYNKEVTAKILSLIRSKTQSDATTPLRQRTGSAAITRVADASSDAQH